MAILLIRLTACVMTSLWPGSVPRSRNFNGTDNNSQTPSFYLLFTMLSWLLPFFLSLAAAVPLTTSYPRDIATVTAEHERINNKYFEADEALDSYTLHARAISPQHYPDLAASPDYYNDYENSIYYRRLSKRL
jgi:hypothetical protein